MRSGHNFKCFSILLGAVILMVWFPLGQRTKRPAVGGSVGAIETWLRQ
jgi:hypothetical protein